MVFEHRGDRDQYQHHLARGDGDPHQRMPQPAAAASFVENGQLVAGKHFANGDDDFVRQLVLDPAVVHRDDGVTAAFVNAGDHAALFVKTEGGVDLVAVVQRLLGAEDGAQRTEIAEQRLQPLLLQCELRGVIHALILTAAAGGEVRTAFHAELLSKRQAKIFNSIITQFRGKNQPLRGAKRENPECS